MILWYSASVWALMLVYLLSFVIVVVNTESLWDAGPSYP